MLTVRHKNKLQSFPQKISAGRGHDWISSWRPKWTWE